MTIELKGFTHFLMEDVGLALGPRASATERIQNLGTINVISEFQPFNK